MALVELLARCSLQPRAAPSAVVVGWQLYDWAESATLIAYNLFVPTLIAALGDRLRGLSGKSLWGFLNGATTLCIVLCFVSLTAVADYGALKRRLLVPLSLLGAACLVGFVFVFTPAAVPLACVFFFVSQVARKVAGVCYDALLYPVAALYDHDVYAVSAGGFTLGYIGMGVFTVCLAVVVGVPWLAGASNELWLFSIIPIVAAGLWWGAFSFQVGRMIPDDFGVGEPYPPELKGKGWTAVFWYGLVHGLREQYEAFLVLLGMPDLGYCFLAVMFLSDAASTAYGVAAILATDVLGFSTAVLAGATVVGFIAAVVGLKFFTWVVERRYLVAKQVLLLNLCLLCLLLLYVLWMETVVDLFFIILIGGFQIGSMGNFTRSLVSLMIPVRRSAKLFSLYDLTQKGTSWIAPIVIAALTQHYGDGRYRVIVVLTILVEMAIGIPILAFCCNVERGQQLKKQLDCADAANADQEAVQKVHQEAAGERQGDNPEKLVSVVEIPAQRQVGNHHHHHR